MEQMIVNVSTQEQVGEDRWTDISPSIKGVVNPLAILNPRNQKSFSSLRLQDIKVIKLYSTLTRSSCAHSQENNFLSDWMLFNRGCFLNQIHSSALFQCCMLKQVLCLVDFAVSSRHAQKLFELMPERNLVFFLLCFENFFYRISVIKKAYR